MPSIVTVRTPNKMSTDKINLCKVLDQLLGFGEHDSGASLDVLEHLLTIESREVRLDNWMLTCVSTTRSLYLGTNAS